MKILEKILVHKRKEVAEKRALYPLALLEKSIFFHTPTVSLRKYLLRTDKTGVIAEFKRRSPSKGNLNPYADPERVTIGYMQAGAAAISVLTDSHFFGGSAEDLKTARRLNFCPILCKDFILDTYQITEARALGADAILLISEALTAKEIRELAAFAKSLGLEVLLEMHSAAGLEKLCPEIDVVGVNNRDLQDFSVDLATSVDVGRRLPADMVRISESGIQSARDAAMLRAQGFQGFLIGELFMREAEPERACARFIQEFRKEMLQEELS